MQLMMGSSVRRRHASEHPATPPEYDGMHCLSFDKPASPAQRFLRLCPSLLVRTCLCQHGWRCRLHREPAGVMC